ncbi:unnamed protein product [Heterosigma akashiwo]
MVWGFLQCLSPLTSPKITTTTTTTIKHAEKGEKQLNKSAEILGIALVTRYLQVCTSCTEAGFSKQQEYISDTYPTPLGDYLLRKKNWKKEPQTKERRQSCETQL